jgi:TRAP-type C4-dicarboxylate transport system permease small subunit
MNRNKWSYVFRSHDLVELVLTYLAAAVIFGMGALVVIHVSLRVVYRAPSGTYEVIPILLVACIFLGLAYTQRVWGHARMTLFLDTLSERKRRMVELFFIAIWLATFSIITFNSAKNALMSYQVGDTAMGVVTFPLWPSKALVPFGSFILCLRFLRQIVEHFIWLFSPSALTFLIPQEQREQIENE